MTTDNDDAHLEAIDNCLGVFKDTTMRPWRFIDREQNIRLVRRLGKSRKKLTKRDGLWYTLLAGPVHPYTIPDPDPFDHRWVYGLRWAQIRGEEVWNGSPSDADQKLIEQSVNMHEPLLVAMRAVAEYANELASVGDEAIAERLDAILAPVFAAVDAKKPHQSETTPPGMPTVRDLKMWDEVQANPRPH
jgi:hypothetical protein